jgi:hypothetical protein
MTAGFSFDGGMNVQVAQNLVKNFKYAASYNGIVEFDPKIQTGLPVILPVAILFKLFGASFANGLIINAIYLFLLVLAIVYYLKYCANLNNFFVLLAISMFYGTPALFEYGFGLYGEIPTLFYFLVALIFLHKYERTSKSKFIFWAGVIIGLGYLTKTVILISIPAFVFVAIFDYLFKRRLSIKSYVQQYVRLPLGFLIPVFVFEIYKLISLGFNVYFQWWHDQLRAILLQAGFKSGYVDTNGFFDKFITHLDLLSSYVKVNKTIIIFLLLLLLMSFMGILLYSIYTHWRKKKFVKGDTHLFSNNFLVLMTVTLSYFGWWLLITPTQKAFYRRIIDGSILLELCIVIMFSLLYMFSKKLVERSKKTPYKLYNASVITISMLLLATSAFGISRTKNYSISFNDTPAKASLLEAGEFINSLPPEAEFFGYGWWQAPNVAFASSRSFKDIQNSPEMDDAGPKNEKYFVVDQYAYSINPKGYKAILSKYDNQLVFSRNHILIYKLTFRSLFTYPEFSDEEKRQVSYNKIDFTTVDNADIFVRNVYVDEKNNSGKWAQKLSGYLLKYNDERTLRITFWVPKLERYDRQPIELEVFVNKVLVTEFEINHDGSHEIDIPLENINGSTIEVSLLSNAKLLVADDPRELSVVLIKMELVKRRFNFQVQL